MDERSGRTGAQAEREQHFGWRPPNTSPTQHNLLQVQ